MSGKPNILLICTDQQSMQAMSAYGNRHLHTPHMDSIAANGVRFERSYCASPVCSPSRAAIVTGRMPHEINANYIGEQGLKPSTPTIGQILRSPLKQGDRYNTAWVGKWHLSQHFAGSTAGNTPGFEPLAISPVIDQHHWNNFNSAPSLHLGTCTDEPVADQAIAFLRRHHTRPFFLAAGFQNPHDICYWIRNPRNEPIGDNLSLPANFERDSHEPQFITWCRLRSYYGGENECTKTWGEQQWLSYLYAYYRLTEQVDAAIGRVLHELNELGLKENTLIIFTSDHGEGMAAHQLVVKLMLYEEVATVPLILSWKGVIPSGLVDQKHLASGIDILPTLCDYADIKPQETLTGMSLRPLIEDPKLDGRDFLVTELAPDPRQPDLLGRMVRSERYKYIVFSHGENPEMLFDMHEDPGEIHNLASDKELTDQIAHHRKCLQQWIRQTKDYFTIPSMF